MTEVSADLGADWRKSEQPHVTIGKIRRQGFYHKTPQGPRIVWKLAGREWKIQP